MKRITANPYLDGMMGLVVGDALGVPVEFVSGEELSKKPVTGMTGHGTYNVPKGSWSDDSSMALATLDVLREGINLDKIMANFVSWEQQGEFTPFGETFDEGITCHMAIQNYRKSNDVTTCGLSDEYSNGNGSLMRILPVCIYLAKLQEEEKMTDADAISMIHAVSALTHAHVRSKMACGIYYFCVRSCMDRIGSISDWLQAGVDAAFSYYDQIEECRTELQHFSRIRNLQILQSLPKSEIKSGGYVIESIEASFWCLLTTASYKDCVLKAVNLGHDTDTTAAIAGGLAGLYYGYDAIPKAWKWDIIRRDWIEKMCEDCIR